jgi:hypothetical protein
MDKPVHPRKAAGANAVVDVLLLVAKPVSRPSRRSEHVQDVLDVERANVRREEVEQFALLG